MRIESDIKLDYSSVLMRPKRSVLGSRKDVGLLIVIISQANQD